MTKRYIIQSTKYLILSLISLVSIFPLCWMAIAATNSSIDIVRGTLTPGNMLLENFKNLIEQQNLGRAFYNSCRNSVLLTLFSVILSSIAGYGFEIYHDKAKDKVMAILLLSMMLPFVAIMIPLFRLFSQAKMIDTWAAYMLPSLSSPFLILLFRQSARSFPKEIIESARLDGLSEIGIFIRMFIPTMRSTYGAAITVTFMGAWNSYLWPKIIFQTNESVTMPMLVGNLMTGYEMDYGIIMLAVLICTIPTAVIFLVLQKSFAQGLTGSVK